MALVLVTLAIFLVTLEMLLVTFFMGIIIAGARYAQGHFFLVLCLVTRRCLS